MTHPQTSHQSNQTRAQHRAAVYVRETPRGRLPDGADPGERINTQIRACEQAAAARGAVVVMQYVEIDEGNHQPVLRHVWRELPALGVHYLLVHTLDRLTRSRVEEMRIRRALSEIGITLVSAIRSHNAVPRTSILAVAHSSVARSREHIAANDREGEAR